MTDPKHAMVPLEVGPEIWEHFFMVFPLVIVGTIEENGTPDLATKHMAMPLSWKTHYGFVCTPRHRTYQNVVREKSFTVSFPRPDQIVHASLAAAPRCADGQKHSLQALPTRPATHIKGVLLESAYLHLECELDRIIDGFAENGLIVGRIVAAAVAEHCQRGPDRDDQEVLARDPILSYLHPGRYAAIDESFSFPYHQGFSR